MLKGENGNMLDHILKTNKKEKKETYEHVKNKNKKKWKWENKGEKRERRENVKIWKRTRGTCKSKKRGKVRNCKKEKM